MTSDDNPSLGIGTLLSQTLTVFRQGFAAVFLLGLIFALINALLNALFLLVWTPLHFEVVALQMNSQSGSAALGVGDGVSTEPMLRAIEILPIERIALVFHFFVRLIPFALLIAAVAQLVMDARSNRAADLKSYIRVAIQVIGPVVLVATITVLATSVGISLLVVPGLWVLAVLSVAVPVVVFEGGALSALKRSAALTRDYRWPIVVYLLIVVLVFLMLSVVSSELLSLALGGLMLSDGYLGFVLRLSVMSAASAFFVGMAAIPLPLLYLRLREIKEGVRST